MKQPNNQLRSQQSYGKNDKDGFIHRSWMKSQGLPDEAFDGRPVIGICNTWSELTPCNMNLRTLAEYVKRGVWECGGLPVEFPAMSLGETQMRPTAMLFRNLLAMDVEESIRGNPIDGVVLLGGCDKTTPGQLMGAASVDLPTLIVSTGPMLNGKFQGHNIGSGTDVWKFSEAVRANNMTMDNFIAAERGMSRSAGTCMTMGSASTFAALAEVLGLALPNNATTPAVDAGRQLIAHKSGRLIVDMVRNNRTLSSILTKQAIANAIAVYTAIGGSTNALLHILAIAGRLNLDLNLQDFDTLSQSIPLLLNLQPSGQYLMEDFHYAGGLPALMNQLSEHLNGKCPTVTGQPIASYYQSAQTFNDNVIAPLNKPFKQQAGTYVLHGNLCPNGAIIKISAASNNLLKHSGKAVVFENIEDMKARIDSEDLNVDENSILVLKGCGPKGYPGMPEVGNMPIPKKLLQKGITDLIRISDARMSGTAYGTVILHVAPEAEANGPIAIVQNGDNIAFDAEKRQLNLLIDDAEFDKRMHQQKNQFNPTPPLRGYQKLYYDHVLQADKGCDLDFLVGSSGSIVARESH